MTGSYGYSRLMPHVQRVPGETPLPYVQTGTRTLIIGAVTLFHAAMLILPVVFLAISEKINPPVFVMQLPMVDSEPNSNEIMSPYPDPRRKTPDGVPDKGDPDPDLPPIEQFEPIQDLPKLPDPPKPDPPKAEKAEPQPDPPAPQPQPKETAKPEKRSVKDVPEIVKQTPVENGKGKTPAKTERKQRKKYLTAEDIKISRKVVRTTTRKTSGNAAEAANARAEAAKNARNAAVARRLRNLSKYGVSGGQGTPGGGGGHHGVVSREINDYYYTVEAFLKQRWNQPRLLQKTADLKVMVEIAVDARGRVLSAKITGMSGNSAMDASVQALVAGLNTLPKPPKAMRFEVTMEIDR